MIQNLTPQEIRECELLYDPIALSECLFSDMDNLSLFDEEQKWGVRLGQEALFSYEYMLFDEPNATRKEHFKARENAGNIWCFGGRRFGKCEYSESEILLADGTYRKYKDLIETTQSVLSLNPSNMQIENSIAHFHDNGVKDCLKLSLRSGKEITVTLNHPLLSDNGWKLSNEFKIGDFVGTPRHIDIKNTIDVEPQVAKILGYLIGDGSCKYSSPAFTNINEELIKEFIELSTYFGCEIRKSGMTYHTRKPKKGTQLNNIAKLLRKYDLNTLSKNKVLPQEIFRWSNDNIALLLNRLFACDGYINKNNTIEIGLASKKLIYQIQSLLLRFGVHSYIKYKKAKCNGKYFDCWRLYLNKDSGKFIKLIGIKSKEHKFTERIVPHTTSDVIPVNFIKNIYHEFKYKKPLSLRKLLCYNPTTNKLANINKIEKNSKLELLLDANIYWDEVLSIELIKDLPTVVVSVPGNNNYISNNIFSHNSICVEIIDILISMILNDADNVGFSSYDFNHIRGILEIVVQALDNHPILHSFKSKVSRSPSYLLILKNGYRLESINMNLAARNSGNAWFQKHFTRIYIEESSFETQEVYEKRLDAVSEFGCVFRISGMTNFTKYSPAGKAFYDLALRPWLCNLPQYLTPTWDDREKEKAIKKHSGENSTSYRIFVKGEVVENGISVFDMSRIRKECYDVDKEVKYFEITKENYEVFHQILAIERPKNCEVGYICADIGESAPTEIILMFKINDKYRYDYNITLYELNDKEIFKVMKYIATKLSLEYIGIDAGDGSIDKDEFILCKVNNQLNYCRAGNLESFFDTNKNITVPTYNNGKVEWKPATVYKHPYEGKMYKFTVNPSSASIKVTPNHSMMVYTDKGLIEKRAENIKVNDWVVSLKLNNTEEHEFNLEYKRTKVNKFSKPVLKSIKLDERLAYFLGWCAAEGCSKTACYQLTLGDEKEEAEKLLLLFRELFNYNSGYIYKNTRQNNEPRIFKNKLIRSYKDTYTVILGGGVGVKEFIENLVGIGSHNKKVPIEIINSSIAIKKAFLSGLIEGDGNIRKRRNANEYQIKVASDELVYGIALILKQLNLYPSFLHLQDEWCESFVISWTDKPIIGRWQGIPYSIIPMKNGKSRINKKVYDIQDLLEHRVSSDKINRIKELLQYDFLFKKIIKIEQYDYNDTVYDLMVKDNNTFCAGNENIIVHNTGRSIYRSFEECRLKAKLCWYQGAMKIAVGFDKDDNDNIIFKDGMPTHREEFMAEWAVLHLKELFYQSELIIPVDYKLDEQLNSVISTQTGNRTVYTCASSEDHLFDAFKVFSIAHWQNVLGNLSASSSKEFSKVGC